MVLIVWNDSTNHTQGWTFESITETIDIATCGFIVEETDDVYVLSHSVGWNDSHFDSFVIPKGCVKEVVVLDKAESKTQVQQRNRKKG
jgi:hypothetical protein